MKQMSLEQIAKACGGTYIGEEEQRNTEITGAVIDSRQVESGYLYIPMRGERVDGHRFIPDVFKKGAAAVLSEEVLTDPAGPYIRVDSSAQALKDIAEYYRSTLNIKIIGIAGSVGKTSTKEMIAAVLEQKYRVLKTEGNFNNEIGLPLTLLRIRSEHEVAVVEMGISDFGEMHRLAKMAKPDICVMTNIGQCHLENLKDRDGILRAKSEIFDFLKEDGAIILNGNDDKLSTIREVRGVTPMRYFVEDGTADKQEDQSYYVWADAIQNRGLLGMDATLHFPEEISPIHEPIPGVHNIYNACAAACVGHVMGLTNEEIRAGIATAKTIAGRTNLIEAGNVMIIDDCYNANPVSMKASLDVLSLAEGRKIAVLGDMGELGEDEKELHRQIGAYAVEKQIDTVFCAGTLSAELAKAASKECETFHFDSRQQLTDALLDFVKPGDTVLVKASHFMEFPKIVQELTEHCKK
jgi:UDP-N-acetylmuramoyl-tripeptide--D-alanyl-D-alanine ligase